MPDQASPEPPSDYSSEEAYNELIQRQEEQRQLYDQSSDLLEQQHDSAIQQFENYAPKRRDPATYAWITRP